MNDIPRRPAVVALIVAAGKGERAGLDQPKQYVRIAGRSVLAHAYDALASHQAIDRIVVAIGDGQEEAASAALGDRQPAAIVIGGATRRESVVAGLNHLEAQGGADIVLVHDAARPFLPAAVIDRLLLALESAKGAVPTLPVVDTLVTGAGNMGDVVDRSILNRVQTPQAFHFAELLAAHRQWALPVEPTDDAQVLRSNGRDVVMVEGDPMLEKLTLPADFDRAARSAAPPLSYRTGMGYDVHRLVAGEDLWLCGVQIPHAFGLSGHSDADVALHALVDAILGALADGDIGSHFPPTDSQWRGAASSRFLEYARDRVIARGGRIAHVDVTIICEAPKVGPHRDAMRMRVAELLRIPVDRVSIKATTTERLGFAGRREGIAAQAVATVALPDIL